MADDQLQDAFDLTLYDGDLRSLVVDGTVMTVEQLLGAMGLPPVLSLLKDTYGLLGSIPTRLFARKLVRFLAGLSDLSPDDRRKMLSRLEILESERKRIGETLLLLLDRMNDMRKPDMLQRAFRALLRKEIDLKQFHGLCHAIDSILLIHISDLRDFYSAETGPDDRTIPPGTETPSEDVLSHLAICGLITINYGFDYLPFEGGSFAKNELGTLFVGKVLK